MTIPEMVAAFGVPLLTLLLAVVGVIYRNDQKSFEAYKSDAARVRAEDLARLIALEKQNTEQETRIATLIANHTSLTSAIDRLDDGIEKLGNKIDALGLYLAGKRPTPEPFPRVK